MPYVCLCVCVCVCAWKANMNTPGFRYRLGLRGCFTRLHVYSTLLSPLALPPAWNGHRNACFSRRTAFPTVRFFHRTIPPPCWATQRLLPAVIRANASARKNPFTSTERKVVENGDFVRRKGVGAEGCDGGYNTPREEEEEEGRKNNTTTPRKHTKYKITVLRAGSVIDRLLRRPQLQSDIVQLEG